MPKISTARWTKVLRKVQEMRTRPISPDRETLNESRARELVARTLILPQLKRIFGPRLLSVVVFGSVQVGVRKATRQPRRIGAYPSDLDLTIVLDTRSISSRESARLNILEKKCATLFPTNLRPVTSDKFVRELVHIPEPFQTIFGQPAIEKILKEANFFGKNRLTELRKQLQKKSKYS